MGGGHVAGIGERREAYRVLVEEAEGKRVIGRLRHRCVVTRLQKIPCYTTQCHYTLQLCGVMNATGTNGPTCF